MSRSVHQQKIKDLVSENHNFASVLHFFGIRFYQNPEVTLEEVCHEKSIDLRSVVKGLEAANFRTAPLLDGHLHDLPVELLIAYLQKAHRSFIRHKLPYMSELIAQIAPERFDHPEIAKDLKFVFPIFAEDFVQHIYEEEKNSFGHIEMLQKAASGDFDPCTLFESLQGCSIEKMMEEHLEDDDEMQGIRELTNNYEVTPGTGIYTKVVYKELQNFEEDLKVHSCIENDILLPKAAELERKAALLLAKKAQMN